MFFNLFFILQFVLPKSNPASKNSNPSQEHQGKEKNKLSSLTLSLMNSSSPIYSQQEQLSWSQDPNNMTTQNQEQLSWSQDPNSMTHKINPSKTQTEWPIWGRAPPFQWWRWTRWDWQRRERPIRPTSRMFSLSQPKLMAFMSELQTCITTTSYSGSISEPSPFSLFL